MNGDIPVFDEVPHLLIIEEVLLIDHDRTPFVRLFDGPTIRTDSAYGMPPYCR